MYYYKAKDNKSFLAFKNELTTENYPEYTAERIAMYEEITKAEFNSLGRFEPKDEAL